MGSPGILVATNNGALPTKVLASARQSRRKEVMKDIIINTMAKGDNGHWTATGTLEGNDFEAKTIKYGHDLIFKVVEGGDIAKSLTDSEFSRGDRVSIAAACKAVRTVLEINGDDELTSPTKPGKQAKSAAGTGTPRTRKVKDESAATGSDSAVAAAENAIADAEKTRLEIEAIRALLSATPAIDEDLEAFEADSEEEEESDDSE
jgi:hypothetical protein